MDDMHDFSAAEEREQQLLKTNERILFTEEQESD
jgi:hypothetical protein